ncbi:ABC transporter substrate-binding protein [Desulfofalx alkaliphila]|uniref:ABC transporter substrate-binding protein n=1 Tax=Desulfofalx alkaliphila TaxID=105483 RepID=UPI0004E14D5D|nr:ABC transporter substrate-binding protein [Desulfofalx alkaliphila]
MKNLIMRGKRYSLVALLVILMMAFATGCGGGSTDGDTQGATESIVRVTAANVPNIDPGVGSDYSSSIALLNIYDSLVFPDDDGTIKPWLATEWETSDDGLVWTFHLRDDVKFHSGNQLTADDVVFSMKRMLTMGEGYAYLFTEVVEDVAALDDYTVQFKLSKKFGPFLSTLARLYVLDSETVMANLADGPYGDMGDYGKAWLVNNDAGSGPYTVKEMKIQEHLIGEKFDDFWGGWQEGAPEAFQIVGTTEPATVRTLLTRKQLEISDQWQTEEAIRALAEIPGVDIATFFTNSMLNISLNTKKAPTDDIHFRKALAYMFDYQAVEEDIFPGSKKAVGPIQFNLPGFDPNLYEYKTNLDKAREELAKSKYADQLDQYPIDLAWIAEVPDEEKIAMLFQANAAELGIKVNVTKTPWLSFTEQVGTPETTPHASVVFVNPHYNEAGSMLETRYHSRSTGTWEQCEWLQDPEIDAMIEDAIATLDFEERLAKYSLIQEKIIELAPTIWVFDQAEKRAYQDYIHWPSAELSKAGKNVNPVMGYPFYFAEFKVLTDN